MPTSTCRGGTRRRCDCAGDPTACRATHEASCSWCRPLLPAWWARGTTRLPPRGAGNLVLAAARATTWNPDRPLLLGGRVLDRGGTQCAEPLGRQHRLARCRPAAQSTLPPP